MAGMSYTANPSQEYLRNAVMTAPPEQLQLMLYDGVIRFATRGLDALRRSDREAAFNALDRAQQIVLELGSGLRREVNPQLADQMAALYNFVYQRLVDANLHQDEKAIDDALRILRHQRETWVMLMEKLREEAAATQSASSQPQPTATDDTPASFTAEG